MRFATTVLVGMFGDERFKLDGIRWLNMETEQELRNLGLVGYYGLSWLLREV